MKKILIIMLLSILIISLQANKLENTTWEITNVECNIVAKDSADQPLLDSLFKKLEQRMIAPTEQYVYEFTSDKLIKKSKEKESAWDYKEDDGKIIVDMGKGFIIMQQYEIQNDTTLVLELTKELFFLSEFAPKADSIRSLVNDITLKHYYRKKQE